MGKEITLELCFHFKGGGVLLTESRDFTMEGEIT